MMKTPDGKDMNALSETLEKVKKGLECCSKNVLDPCIGCPYERTEIVEWKCGLNADALALIQQLERERDAAVAELKEFDCATCKHCNIEHIASICGKCKDASGWEWRGVKEE